MKIAYQGIAGSYSESCAKEKYPNCDTIPCKTFDECFEKANQDSSIKAIIPESNKTTGNIGVEYLIFKYRLNICAEHFFSINHNLLGIPGSKINDIKNVYSHAQALSQSSDFIKKKKFTRFVKSKLSTTKNGKLKVQILRGQESFRIKSFIQSNVWVLLPSGREKFKKGETVECFFSNQPNKIFL